MALLYLQIIKHLIEPPFVTLQRPKYTHTIDGVLANTQRRSNIVTTSLQRHDVAATL